MTRALHLLGLGAGMCLLGGAFAVPSLYLPGVALLLLAAAAAAVVGAAARGTRVELEVPARSLAEGDRMLIAARVGGAAGLLCRGSLRAAPGAQPVQVGWRRRAVSLEVRPQRRGRVTLGPASVRYADPFEICSRQRSSGVRELLVLPRVHAIRREQLERLLRLPPAGAGHEAVSGADGLRAYRPGSPASRVHWLTVARTGTLVERRLAAEADHVPVTLVLDPRGAANREALDMAVRAAASLCAALARGGCALMLPGFRHPELLDGSLARWQRVHEHLALVEDGAPAWQALHGARRLVLVQAHAPVLAAGLPVSCTVSAVADPRREVLFTIAGCAVQAVAAAAAGRAA